MKSAFRTLAIGSLLIVSPGPATAQTPTRVPPDDAKSPTESRREIQRRLTRAVVIVEALDEHGEAVEFGSGVVVAAQQVVTNLQVVAQGVSLQVRHDGNIWPATITHLDADHDLCRLRVRGLKDPSLSVRPSLTLEAGETAFAVGSPDGRSAVLTSGIVFELQTYGQVRLPRTTAASPSGSGGGGVFDSRGRLIGITTVLLEAGTNLSFVLPGEWIVTLESHPARANAKPTRRTRAFQALVSFEMGSRAQRAGEYEKAASHYRDSLRANPDLVEPWNNLGEVYRELGQYDEAIRAHQEALRRQPGAARAWFNLGFSVSQKHEFAQAVQAYREAVRFEPGMAEAWNNLGNLYRQLGQNERAIQAYQEALRLRPDDAKARFNLGYAYDDLQQYDLAVKAYQEGLRHQPEFSPGWNNLGYAYEKLREFDKAVHAYLEAVRLQPNLADAWTNLGNGYRGLRQYDLAVQSYREALRLRSDDLKARFNLGYTYNDLGRYSEAVTEYLEVLHVHSDDPFAWNNLGYAYNHLGRYDQALRAYQEAVRLQESRQMKPELAKAWSDLAGVYKQLGLYDQAAKAYQEALQLRPDDVEGWYRLAHTFHVQGNDARVLEVYLQLKTLDPNLAEKVFRELIIFKDN
ncbi:MAG: tetratricopeptide repeat protein [Acidobacteria bacterium]|nr:tetratricopeptide repeat protein [Acidobacteriota bacterium]